jgi:hypothetical protein
LTKHTCSEKCMYAQFNKTSRRYVFNDCEICKKHFKTSTGKVCCSQQCATRKLRLDDVKDGSNPNCEN